jgi:hypothetical protein
MKHLTSSLLALFLLLATGMDLRSQESELGALPPLPDLDLGDPERKFSWREKREMAKKAEEKRTEANVYRRQPEDSGRATLGQRLSNAASQPEKKPLSQQITVHNSLPGGEDGITASGSRLQAFGDSDFWGAMPPPTPEESLIDLPPLPDLRTPDQVTRRERIRDIRVARYEQRKSQIDATREEKEMRERAIVNRPAADPSSALVQVESQGSRGAGYAGNQSAPETVDEGALKPFNEGSVYYKDSQMVYKGDRRDASTEAWWKRGANKQEWSAESSTRSE